MSELLEHAKDAARRNAERLTEPDEGIMPVFLWLGPRGVGLMPIGPMLQDEETKDMLALHMTAAMVVGRATEAVMVTTAWTVKREMTDEEKAAYKRGTYGIVPPSKDPDRVEIIGLMRVSNEGDDMHQAELIRHPDRPPDIGEWESIGAAKVGGRFGDAMHLGLDFVRDMPEAMTEIIEEGWENGEQEDLIQRFVKVTYGITKGKWNAGNN